MSSSAELAASLAEAEGQLEAVEAGLSGDPSCQDLLDLKQQLVTLIELTKEGLLEQKKAELLAEVGQLEGGEGDSEEPNSASKEELETSLEEDFSQLVGLRVSAPLSSLPPVEWGNAVVVGVEQEAGNFGEVMVRLAFSNPTRLGLVPCQHYLNGRCSREASQCKWSHGELLKLGSLRQWREPDYSLLKPGTEVLVKGEDGVWERATVGEELMGEFMVTPNKVGAEPLCKTAADLLPLVAAEEEEDSDDGDDDDDQLEKSLEDEENFKPLDLNVSTDRLGGWEEHTKGIGSRLMLSMGWQAGSGLGKAGGGRVDPVEARIYPQGKSLDWCMEKREELGESSVEKVVRDEAKDAERKSKRRAEAERRRDESAKSLFDFINVKLRSGTGINIDPNHGKRKSKNGFSNNKRTESVPLKEETSKNLKIRQFELGESITRVEKEISKYRESHERLKVKDPKSAATVQAKLEAKMVELRKLQQKESRLKQEEGSRSAKSKLAIF